MTPTIRRISLVCRWAAVALLGQGCAASAPQLLEEARIEQSEGDRPSWMSMMPEDTDEHLYSVGRAQSSTESGAITDAREDASRQLVDTHYGSVLQKDYERVRTEVANHIVDRLKSKSEGRVTGARAHHMYWERWKQQRGVHEVGYYYRAWVLMRVDRGPFETAVSEWIATSPSVVESARLAREAADTATRLSRTAEEGTAAAEAGRISAMARLHVEAERLDGELTAKMDRHRELLGREPDVDRDGSLRRLDLLRDEVAKALRKLKVGYWVNVATQGDGSEPEARGIVGDALASLGLPAEDSDSKSCRTGWSHLLLVTVGKPVFTRPGMGEMCELPFALKLLRCPAKKVLDTAKLPRAISRGAAMNRDDALRKAWKNLRGANKVAVQSAFGEVLSRHIPITRGAKAP